MDFLAHVGGFGQNYLAELSNGRKLVAPDLLAMATALHRAGVSANEVDFSLRPGWRLLTSGQQVALRAEIRHLGEGCPPINAAVAQSPATGWRAADFRA